MNNTINLIKKDFLTFIFRKRTLIILLLAISYPFFAPEFITFSTLLIMYSFVVLPFIEEEQFNSNYLNYYLPINKSSFVLARYCMLLIALCLSTFLIFSSNIMTGNFNIEAFSFIASISLFSSILLGTIAIPCFLKFGGSTTRNLFILITVALTFISNNIINSNFLNKIFNIELPTLVLYMIIFSIILFICSLLFSIKIYNTKELKN